MSDNIRSCPVCGDTDWFLEPAVDEATGLVDSQWQPCTQCLGGKARDGDGDRASGASDTVVLNVVQVHRVA